MIERWGRGRLRTVLSVFCATAEVIVRENIVSCFAFVILFNEVDRVYEKVEKFFRRIRYIVEERRLCFGITVEYL